MPNRESLVSEFETECKYTESLLDAVPEAKLAWKPHEKSMSLGQLAGHIAETPMWLGAILEESMNFDDMGDYRPFEPTSKKELVDAFAKNRASFAPALAGKDDAFFESTWTMKKGEKVLMENARKDAIRSILVNHVAHHRGQLTVYLRLLDVPVPPTYGGTADNPMF